MKKLMFGRGSRKLAEEDVLAEEEEDRPSGEQLNKIYKQLLEELAIPQAKRDLMLKNENEERKWQLIKAHSAMLRSENLPSNKDAKKEPAYWVDVIARRNRKNEPVLSLEEASELYAVLRTAHKQFLIEFIEQDGVETLIELTRWLTSRDNKLETERKVLPQIMSSYKALMNNNIGMEGVLAIPDSITSFALGMDLTNESDLHTAQEVVMLLAVTCFYSPEGREMVVAAMDDLRVRWREAQKFQTLVDTFANCDDNEFRAAVIMFITTIVNSASEVESRVRVRNDFLALDIMRVFERVLDEAREEDDESFAIISTQYQVFEDMMAEDHREVVYKLMSGSGEDEELDLSDQRELFEHLRKTAAQTGTSDQLLALTQALLLIPTERSLAVPTWEALTQFVREATDYSKRSGGAKRVRLNYQLLSDLLDRRQELDEKLSQLTSGDDIIGQQRKKITDLQKKVDSLKKNGGKGGKARSSTLSSDSGTEEVQILQEQVAALRDEIKALQKKLSKATKGKPIEDDVEEDDDGPLAGGASDWNGKLDSTGLRPAGTVPGVKSSGPPPCPLPGMPGSLELAPIPTKSGAPTKGASKKGGGAAAPAAPSFGGAALAGMLASRAAGMNKAAAAGGPGGAAGAAGAAPIMSAKEREEEIRKRLGLNKKKPITPAVKMRNIFWTTVSVEKLEGTVWPELSDQKIKFSAKKLEKLFGQTEKETTSAKVAIGGENRKSMGKIHLVTGKRQQNIGIALSKMRASDEEIAHAVLTLDETMLSPNHTQLLLGCVPNDDEIELIKQFESGGGDVRKLAREDRFLRVMCTIPRLGQRLRAVQTKHNFESDYERIEEKVRIVQRACAEIDRSTKLKKLLEIVLALGNYLNGGTPRGAAWGFKLDALAKLDTIKDATHKSTLMDFLYQLLEDNYPDLVDFELPASRLATEVSLGDTMGELNQLASAMRLVKSELEHDPIDKKDRFHKVMAGFEVKASKHVTDLQTDFEKTRSNFHKLASQYAETGAGVEPESFFSKFVRFEVALQRAKRAVADRREREARARRFAEEKHRMKTLKKLKQLEAQGADEGVFAAFAKANAGNAQDIVQGFLQRNRDKAGAERPQRRGTTMSTKSKKSVNGDTMRKKKKKKDIKIVKVVGPDGQIIEKRMKRKKKSKPKPSVPNPDYDMA